MGTELPGFVFGESEMAGPLPDFGVLCVCFRFKLCLSVVTVDALVGVADDADDNEGGEEEPRTSLTNPLPSPFKSEVAADAVMIVEDDVPVTQFFTKGGKKEDCSSSCRENVDKDSQDNI